MSGLLRAPILGLMLALAAGSAAAGASAYLLLGRTGLLDLSFEMDLAIPAPAVGQVFWDARPAREAQTVPVAFSESAMQYFDVRPGTAEYAIALPAAVRALRIDPIAAPGAIALRRITLRYHGLPLRRWSARQGFAGWLPASDLQAVRVDREWLRMQSVGNDPFLVAASLGGLAAEQRRLDAALAGAVALAFLGLQAVLVWPAARGGVAAAPSAPSLARAPVPRARLATAALAIASTVVSGALVYVVYRQFLRRPPSESPVVGGREYEPTIVDRAGRPLSNKPGGLKVVLDPFTLYRNLPGQRTAHFTTDAHGWRGGFDAAAARPRAVVLGGSAAFGLRLDGDGETFAARLREAPGAYEVINAGVVGFVSGQELAEMVHYADAVRPRLYVVFDGWNELLQVLDLRDPAASASLGYNRPIFRTLEDRLWQHALEEQLPAVPPAPPAAADVTREEVLRRITAAYTDNLGRMADFARARDAQLLVAFQPHLGGKRVRSEGEAAEWKAWETSYGAAYPSFGADYEALVRAARAFCAARGIAAVDLTAAPQIADEGRPLFIDAVHLNPDGHRLVAELLRGPIAALTARTSPGSR
jgi:hypothetical protein